MKFAALRAIYRLASTRPTFCKSLFRLEEMDDIISSSIIEKTQRLPRPIEVPLSTQFEGPSTEWWLENHFANKKVEGSANRGVQKSRTALSKLLAPTGVAGAVSGCVPLMQYGRILMWFVVNDRQRAANVMVADELKHSPPGQ